MHRLLLVLLALAPLTLAQETHPEARPDPFATPPPMRRAARAPGDVAAVGTATGLEAVALRGLLLLRERPAVALLEVAGQVHLVRAGDQLLDLSILAVDAAGVTLRTVDGATAQVR